MAKRQRAEMEEMELPLKFYEQINPQAFPHLTVNNDIKPTIENLKFLFDCYGIQCSYNEVLKLQQVSFNEEAQRLSDLDENRKLAQIKSLCALNNIKMSIIDLIPALMSQSIKNPILDMIQSKAWDKVSRLDALVDTLKLEDASHREYLKKALTTWLIQCVAAIDSANSSPLVDAKPKFELVFVLQGGQGVRKTTWFQRLVNKELIAYIKDGVFLNPDNRDSVQRATSAWICELGEIDATLKSNDIARLKAFLSHTNDEVRLPYDKLPNRYLRRTSFCGSVNKKEFLVDETGERRFLPIAILACDGFHTIDMQQLWAEVFELYKNGAIWWMSKELEELVKIHHEAHTETNIIAELLHEHFNLSDTHGLQRYSITRILNMCGVGSPSQKQITQARAELEKHGFSETKYCGIKGYKLNLK